MTSRLAFVALEAPYADHKYGFRTTLNTSHSSVLGHQVLDATTPVTGLIFKANHPKPLLKLLLLVLPPALLLPLLLQVRSRLDGISSKQNPMVENQNLHSKSLYMSRLTA